MKLVEEEMVSLCHLDDWEEQPLVAAVTERGDVRAQVIIVLMLHIELQAQEWCTITRGKVKLGKRSGTITVHGKRNKYREIPLFNR